MVQYNTLNRGNVIGVTTNAIISALMIEGAGTDSTIFKFPIVLYRDCQKVSTQWLFLREVFKLIAHCSYLEGFIYGFPRVIQLIFISKEAETSKRQTLLRRGFSQDPLQFASTEVLETWSWYCMVGFTAIQLSENLFELVFGWSTLRNCFMFCLFYSNISVVYFWDVIVVRWQKTDANTKHLLNSACPTSTFLSLMSPSSACKLEEVLGKASAQKCLSFRGFCLFGYKN